MLLEKDRVVKLYGLSPFPFFWSFWQINPKTPSSYSQFFSAFSFVFIQCNVVNHSPDTELGPPCGVRQLRVAEGELPLPMGGYQVRYIGQGSNPNDNLFAWCQKYPIQIACTLLQFLLWMSYNKIHSNTS